MMPRPDNPPLTARSEGGSSPDISRRRPPGRLARAYLPALLAIALVGLALRCWDLDKPFAFGERGSTEWYGFDNGAFYGVGARNMLRFGPWATRFACVLKTAEPDRLHAGAGDKAEAVFYVRHPPLLTLSLALMFALFGATHLAARIVPLALSVCALLGVARIARRLWGNPAGLVAAAVMAVLPAGSFYGSLVDPQGSLVMGFSVLACDAYITLLRRPASRLALAGLILWLALGCLTDWPGYFVAGLIFLDQLRGLRRSPAAGPSSKVIVSRAAALVVLVVGLLGLHALQLSAVGGSTQGGMIETLQHHSLVGLSRQQSGALTDFLGSCVASSVTLLTLPGALAGILGLLLLIGWRRPTRGPGTRTVWILTGMALLHIFVFAEAARRHLYWFVYLLPPAALGTAALGARLAGVCADGPRRRRRIGNLLGAAVLSIILVAGVRRAATLRFEPDPYFMRLGNLIHRETRADQRVLTSEFPQISLRFYADRWILGKLSDDRLRAVTDMDAFVERLGGRGPTVFVLPESPSYPGRRCERIRAALDARYPSRRIESPIGPVWIYTLQDT